MLHGQTDCFERELSWDETHTIMADRALGRGEENFNQRYGIG